MAFQFGTGRSAFFTINNGGLYFPNNYRNQRRVEEHLNWHHPNVDHDAIAIRDTSLPLSMRLAAWDRWKALDSAIHNEWNNAGRPPCPWCLHIHVPPHISRDQVELRHETRWAGRKLEGGMGPCRRCANHHGRVCKTPQCQFCFNYHYGGVPCERAARRRAAAGLPPVETPSRQHVQQQQHDAEEERRIETIAFEAMRNTVFAMNSAPLDFPTMASYWNSFLRKGDIDPHNLRSVASGAMKALVHGENMTTTAAMAMYLAPLLNELAQEHPSRMQSTLAEMMSAFVHAAVPSLRELHSIARLVDSMASYLVQNTTSKRRMEEEHDDYGRIKRLRTYSDDDVI